MSITLTTPEDTPDITHAFGHRIEFDFQHKQIIVLYSKGYINGEEQVILDDETVKIEGDDYDTIMNFINSKVALQNKLEDYLVNNGYIDGTVNP